jgi:transglutaminase-like putative cysteine protease
MRYRINHQTLYRYSADVFHSHQMLHLVPRPTPYQQCIEHTIWVTPAAHDRRDRIDVFGNPMTRIELEHPHRRLEVCADMEVEVYPRPALPVEDSAPWERVRALLAYHGEPPGLEHLEAGRFRQESPYVPIKKAFCDYAADCFVAGRPLLACADALVEKLHAEFRYAPGETVVGTPLLNVLALRHGVCQDFAHLMIACLRSRGLAARYVSGYVRGLSRRGEQRVEPAAAGPPADAASHAWVAVYSPPFGWVELDPTNNARVSTDHVTVAWGRDFGDVSPLRGTILGGGGHELSVSVSVTPLSPS